MKKLIYIIFTLFTLTGCITNDIPYPVIAPNVLSVDIDGAEKVDIDNANRVITVYLQEYVDPRKVSVKSIDVDVEIAELSSGIIGEHDMSVPYKFVIRTYDDYSWTLVAVKQVERYFTVKGQIGSSEIDEVNCRAVATVGKDTDLEAITVTSLKLGPEGISTYSKEMSELKDFTDGESVEVTFFDQTQVWNLFVEVSEVNVDILGVNPWARKAYVKAAGTAGLDNGVQYREVGSQEWLPVPEADITYDGGTFTALLTGLRPDSTYEVYAYSGEDRTTVWEFTTESATPVPNGSFEYASKVAGKDYYKFYDPACGVNDGMYMFWGSGNGEGSEGVNGSANLGIVITYIDTEIKYDGRQSVRAQTSQMAGMLAAGNLFTGQFAGLVGTSGGMVNFGRPWTSRPTALKISCRYTTDRMDIIKGSPAGLTLTNEDYDRAEIKFAIGDWDYRKYGGTKTSPVHINTTDSDTFVDFNTDASTIANASLVIHHDGYILNGAEKVDAETGEWIEYVIPLNYRSLEKIPTHIIISCAASQFGDYFTGYSGSKLWIDAVELIY